LAALKVVTKSVQIPLMYYQNNLTSPLNLLSLCSKYNIKDFVYFQVSQLFMDHQNICILTKDKTQRFLIKNEILFYLDILSLLVLINQVSLVKIQEGIPNSLMPHIAQAAIG
uniref:Ovule protein n=1 Tax=Strongyloides papillosus TaxID=174720 RepID=A0A0N5C117_STREA